MRDAIKRRISTRSFDKTPLTEAEVAQIRALVMQVNRISGLTIVFLPDGSAAFSSIRKSYGLFSGVSALLVMKGNAAEANLAEKVGYYGEGLVLDLTDADIQTCWVGGTYDPRVLSAGEGEEIVCVIALGHEKTGSLKDRAIRGVLSRGRKSVSQRLHCNGEPPHWVLRGMEAVRLAPSAKNAQKPRFTYAEGQLTASVPGNYAMDAVDLGIAKKHFELEVGGVFAPGNGGAFQPAETGAAI